MGNLIKKLDLGQLKWGLLAGIITVGLMVISYKIGYDRKTCDDSVLGEQQKAEVTDWEVNISVRKDCIDFDSEVVTQGQKEVRNYCLGFEKGKTAFEYMKMLDERSDKFSFDYEESDFGVFVSSVNNYHPDVKTKFWAFLVNGEMSMVGVGDYKAAAGDKLTLQVENVEF
ncbi:MAG: DUF4430 domain-containing protein [Patescibacteria group bacterium]|nr:DUF4430 domain-containing protein [Patescibacteria group bacterium]